MSSCLCQDRSDGALETQLFLRETKHDSFRPYTLVAENSVAARTQQVALIQSELSTIALLNSLNRNSRYVASFSY